MLFTPSLPPAASPREQHHQHFILERDISAVLERSECWKGPGWAASWFLLFRGCEGAAEDTVKPGSRGNQSPVLCLSWGAGSALTPRHKAPHYSLTHATMQTFFPWMWAGAAARCSRAGGGGQGPISRCSNKATTNKKKHTPDQTKKLTSTTIKQCPHWHRLPASFGSEKANLCLCLPKPSGLLWGSCVSAGRADVLQQLCRQCWVGVKLSPWPRGHLSPWLQTPWGHWAVVTPLCSALEMAPWQGVGRKNGELCSSLSCHLSW